jgi:hypothetical protein
MWRWAFLPPDQQENDEVYRSLWGSLLRWLVSSGDLLPGQKVALRTDKATFPVTEGATGTLLLRDQSAESKAPAVELRSEESKEVRKFAPVPLGDEPGVFRVVFGKLPEGRYRARVAGSAPDDTAAATAFDVRSLFDEQLDLTARPDLMARIAEDSGGRVLEASTPEGAVRQFQEHLDRGRRQQVRRLTAWDRWWVFLSVLGVWGMAWAVRRNAGLA